MLFTPNTAQTNSLPPSNHRPLHQRQPSHPTPNPLQRIRRLVICTSIGYVGNDLHLEAASFYKRMHSSQFDRMRLDIHLLLRLALNCSNR
ncbi:hypothetical protein RJ641_002821 [Dillenia turbinata]|uniref:Uncharacterized protein n=1 Tax=Dillenia turbinata TaxID=194707 RepID=A0AAN8VA05_9MAGN